jgi:RNA polymerase sigma factor (sigma-70 family)
MSVVPDMARPPHWVPGPNSAPATGLALLIAGAIDGDQRAWSSLVARYAPLVNSVAQQFRLPPADADDLSQVLWMRVFEHLAELRVPEALPGWISSTARREAIRMTTAKNRTQPVDATGAVCSGADRSPSVEDVVLLADGRRAIRSGLSELSAQQRRLLILLVAEPRLSYRQISQCLGIPVGSVGPTRSRCLRRLANTAPVRALIG